MANLLPFTIMAARELKSRYPDRVIIIGGVGPKSVEAEVLRRFPWIDVISHGEGEHMAADLVRTLRSGGDLGRVPGIFYRAADGEIVRTEPPARIRDLDSVRWPAYERVDLRRYDAYGMVSSRGCDITEVDSCGAHSPRVAAGA